MKKRIISGLILAIILIPTFLLGGIVFKIFIGLVAILAYKELIDLKLVKSSMSLPVLIAGLISLLGLTYLVYDSYALYVGMSYQAITLTVLLMLLPTLFIKNYTTDKAIYLTGFIIFLGTFFNSCIMLMDSNKMNLLYIFLVVCASDVFAYFIGSFVGKHKLTKISPKKTWEGSIGGTICATIIGSFYYAAVFGTSNIVKIIFVSILLSIVGQLGDLFFSKIKRENDIKDYSNLIPGHGGVLDRIDSLSFATILYVLLITII